MQRDDVAGRRAVLAASVLSKNSTVAVGTGGLESRPTSKSSPNVADHHRAG